MKQKVIVFVTDSGFLVPSLMAATQIASSAALLIADIIVYVIDVDEAVLFPLRAAFAPSGIRIEAFGSKSFLPPPGVHFQKGHIPVATLARLSLLEILEERYEDIVYVDGDVQVVRDISPLVAHRVPEGKIMAGLGSAWLDEGDGAIELTPKGYLEGLGNVSPHEYFNAGVLAFRRSTWAEMAPRALDFFFKNSKVCLRHDQSALNAVFKGNVVQFAPSYNFHSVYTSLYGHSLCPPSILHFTGPHKPWNSCRAPWYGRFRRGYADLIEAYPTLKPYLQVTSAPPRLRDRASEVKRIARGNLGLLRLRRRFADYVRTTEFPF